MKKPANLIAQLKVCDPKIKAYVRALESENAKLQTQVAKLQVENLSKSNRIKALVKIKPQEKAPAADPDVVNTELRVLLQSDPLIAHQLRVLLDSIPKGE